MPTIYEIAKAAGVAPGTVSKVFNNYSTINDETKRRVMEVANAMGYRPNITASSLKTKQSFVVGVVFSENAGIGLDHHFFSNILEHFRHRMGEMGYDVIFINKYLGGQEIGYLEHCKYRNVDGVLIITASPDDIDMYKLLESKIKCVTTDMVIESAPFVMSDNVDGGRQAVSYLYEMGHRRIGHIAGALDTMAGGERMAGYRAGLKDVGLEFDPNLIIESGWFTAEQAYTATFEYIKRFDRDTMPTALFVASDVMALSVMKALKKMNIKVPEDISIIGFDDLDVCTLMNPELTSIRQDTIKLADRIAKTLYMLITDSDQVTQPERIPVELVVRETVTKKQ